jgi:hypothetical protein
MFVIQRMAARTRRFLEAFAEAGFDGARLFAPESDYRFTCYHAFGFAARPSAC